MSRFPQHICLYPGKLEHTIILKTILIKWLQLAPCRETYGVKKKQFSTLRSAVVLVARNPQEGSSSMNPTDPGTPLTVAWVVYVGCIDKRTICLWEN